MTENTSSSSHMGFGEIFSKSWEIFTKHFKTIATITLLVYIPIGLILAYFPTPTTDRELEFGWDTPLSIGLETLIGVIAMVAIPLVVSAVVNSPQSSSIDTKTALATAFKKWPQAVWTNILFTIFLIGLLLLFIIPGIIFAVYWSFAIYAVALKEKSGMEALQYSKRIVQGRWWKVFGYTILVGIIIGLCGGIINSLVLGLFPDIYIVRFLSEVLYSIFFAFMIVFLTVFCLHLDETKTSESPSPAQDLK